MQATRAARAKAAEAAALAASGFEMVEVTVPWDLKGGDTMLVEVRALLSLARI